MKLASLLLLTGLCALVASTEVPIWQKQKDVLLLVSHINQEVVYKDWEDVIKTWNVSLKISEYTKPEVVHEFELWYPYDILPKGEVFSVMYEYQLQEAIMLFKLFYYSTTYETFHKTAIWARHYFNEALFLYSYSVAVMHRPDMEGVVLPPIYEIYPHYFYDAAAIQEAYYYKQIHSTQHPSPKYNQQYGYTVFSNYSGYYLNLEAEQDTMSYYLEDVGINAYYYYYNLFYPFWMSGSEYGFSSAHRGEQYLLFYQQLLARFYSERYVNHLDEIPFLDWFVPVETPYYPSLEYPMGLEFPYRPPFANLHEYFYNYGQKWMWKGKYGFSPMFIRDYEVRLNSLIDKGYLFVHGQNISLYTEEGFNTLGNIIESNPDSPDAKFYGPIWYYARHLLGYSYQPITQHSIVPSALEHFETSLRDPVFYQLYKKILLKYYRFLVTLPSYTYKDLMFSGVEVKKVELDKLVTYKELFYSDMSNAVFHNTEELIDDSFKIRVVQERLNHKPFNYKITVDSDHATKSVVKVFMAPPMSLKGHNISLLENQANVILLDYFVYNLQSGENIISRNSHDSQLYGYDYLSYSKLYQEMVKSQHGKGESPTIAHHNYYGFPHRYMLPLGSHSGTPFLFYVFVYPYVPKTTPPTTMSNHLYFYPYEGDKQFYDSYSLMYPFDKPIVHDHIWYNLPNSYVMDTKIYFVDDINVV